MTKRKSSKSTQGQKPLAPLTGCAGILTVLLVLVAAALTGADPVELLDMLLAPPPEPITTTTESGADWWHVYFTTPVNSNDPALFVNGIDQRLVEAIDKAIRSVDVVAFEFNLSSVTDALIRARARGVKVRVVTDDEHGLEDLDTTLDQLIEAGIPVIDDHRNALMHNKFVIIDGRQVWTGSWNFTQNGTFRNNNNVIVIDSEALAQIYTREFGEMFGGRKFGGQSPSYANANEQKVVINGTPIQAYFAPEDDVADKIAALLAEADTSIRFMAFSFTHDAIGEAVRRRAAAGVDVAGIFEKRGSKTEYSELTQLFCAHLPVRVDGNPRVLHHKVFIIDNETVILGSFNFSNNADRSNDENILIIRNAEIAAQYNAEFDRRWSEGSPPDADDLKCH